MKDELKTKKQLISELKVLRKQIKKLEKSGSNYKKSADIYQECLDRCSTFLQNEPNPALIIDNKGRYIDCNETALRFLECARDELLKKSVYDYIAPGDDEKQLLKEHKKLWKEGGIAETDYYINGKIKTLNLSITPIMWGTKKAVLVIGKESTEIKYLDHLSESLLDKIITGVSMINAKMEIVWINKSLRDCFPNIDVRKKPICYGSFYSPPKKEICDYCPVIKAFKTGKVYSSETGICADGRIYNVVAVPVKDVSGMTNYVVENVIDITEEKKAAEAVELEHRKMMSIFDNIDEVVYVSDPDSHEILYANYVVKKQFGDVVGQKCYKVFQNMDFPCDFCTNKFIFGKNVGKPYIWEFRNRMNNRWYRCIDKAIRWTDGRMVRYEMAIDINNKKEIEIALIDSQEKYRDLYDNAPDMYHSIDNNGVIIDCNLTEARMLGYEIEEIVGRHITDFFTEESTRLFYEDFPKLNYEKTQLNLEREFVRKDGTTFPASLNVYSEFNENGELIKTKTIARDITLQKQAEKALKESEATKRSILEAAPIVIGLVQNGLFSWVNDKMNELLGYVEDELYGKSERILYESVKEFKRIKKQRDESLLKHGSSNIETQWKCKDGGIINIYLRSAAVNPSDISQSVIFTAVDITELKLAEEALMTSEERYRVLFEDSRDTVYITTRDGTFLEINKAGLELFGYNRKEIVGQSAFKIYVNPDDRTKFQNEIEKNGYVRDYEIKFRKKDGTEVNCLLTSTLWKTVDGRVLGYQGMIRDVTERRRMEEELFRVEKLESIGILAGGIAHDFNNILTAILGNITLATMYTKPEDELFKRLIESEKAVLRAKDLTQQLLTFSKGGVPIKKTVSIGELIRDSTSFALRGSNVKCEFMFPENLWPVEIDEGQISQVINNLVINADQAMPEGGTIEIVAENKTIEYESSQSLSEGRYVEITIKDMGIGIQKEHLQKIFDPYFTTKQKGSGLGLAVTYSIVKQHSGHITIESEYGAGTNVHIYLPASEKEIPDKKYAEKRPIIGKGRILFMDDEEIVRNVAGEMLRQLGYEVEFALDGAEAIELYSEAKESERPFDSVIMDLTVPGGMGGREAIKKLVEIDPGVKAIVSSGYSNDPVMANYWDYGFSNVIVKPYNMVEISEILYRVITEQSG